MDMFSRYIKSIALICARDEWTHDAAALGERTLASRAAAWELSVLGSMGEIDEGAASRIHTSINHLQAGGHECAEGDWRSIARIGNRFARIAQFIDTEADGCAGWHRLNARD